MKRFCAILLVIMLLAGNVFSYAEDINDGEFEITFDDSDELDIEDVEAFKGDNLSIEGEEVDIEDGILEGVVQDLEGLEDQDSLGMETEEANAGAEIATNASSVTINDYSYTFSNGRACITGYKGGATSITLPTSVEYDGTTYKVTGIGDKAFESTNLASVEIPDTINSLGSYAFRHCVNLISLTINGDLKSSDYYYGASVQPPFYDTGSTSGGYSVSFGSGVTSIPHHLFYTGSSKVADEYAHINSISFPDTLSSIGASAFENCYDLSTINWGNGLTTIGESAFESDVSLTVISLPSKVTTIGDSAFESCTKLGKVTLPSATNSLGSYAFRHCVSLISLTINGDLKSGDYYYGASVQPPFYDTGSTSGGYSVGFGSGVTSIPHHLFYTGSSKVADEYAHINSISFPDTLTSIGASAFENCYDLSTINWGNGLTTIGESAFESDVSLTVISLPSKVTTIGDSAFESCTKLGKATLPSATNSLGSYAFRHCVSLTSLTINGDLKSGDYYYGASVQPPFYDTGSTSGGYSVSFGSGVTSIPHHLFYTGSSQVANEYAHLTSVSLPVTLTSIGEAAFQKCYDLSSAVYAGSQNAWNSISIGDNNEYLLNAGFTYGQGGTVIATGVTLSQTSLSLSKGATASLTATVEPADTTDKGITWSSSNKDVATVDNGKVKAVGVGKATIKATSTSNTNVSASCEVTVTEGTIPVTGVTISQSTLSLSVGGNATLTASVQPTDATEQGITWSSSNTSVATVSNSGVVKAVAVGSATITAASKADSSKKATCAVTVSSDTVLATSIALDKSAVTLKVGETATLTRTIMPSNVTTTKGSYKVSNKSVFKVNNSKINGNTCNYTIEAVGEGTATLTVYTEDGTQLSASCTVTVTPDIPTKDLTRTGSNGTVKINKGTQLQLVASFATKKGWKIKSVTSSNKKVATVNSGGLITAKKAGSATITVKTKNGKKATVKITVIDPKAPTKVTLNKSGTVKLKKGKTLQLKATVSPSTAETILTWKSSKTKVATVTQNGLVKAKKKGTTTITVKTENGKTATVKIKVV